MVVLETVDQSTATPSTETLADMIVDIKESCNIAIDILNDLLLFDKVEEGNMTVSLRSIPFKRFYIPFLPPSF